MINVAVAICTYRRPDGLRRALRAVDKLRMADICDGDIAVVVVDNSPDASAMPVCAVQEVQGRFMVSGVHEPRKGLSNARNAAVREARRLGARFLAFVDDDEMPEAGWLSSLLTAIRRQSAVVAAGPTYPVFATPPGRWIPVEAYAYVPKHDGERALDGSSGNMAIDLERLAATGEEFDPAFNETGGEDTALVARLRARGEHVAWAGDAIVWDMVPEDRARLGWICRRWYRTGTTEARIASTYRVRALGQIVNLARGFARIAVGGLGTLLAIPLAVAGRPDRLTARLYTLCRGAGYLVGAFGRSYGEYETRRYR